MKPSKIKEHIPEIRAARERGETLQSIADRYGVSLSAIYAVAPTKNPRKPRKVITDECFKPVEQITLSDRAIRLYFESDRDMSLSAWAEEMGTERRYVVERAAALGYWVIE